MIKKLKFLWRLIFHYDWTYYHCVNSGLWDNGAVGRSGWIGLPKFKYVSKGMGESYYEGSYRNIYIWDESDRKFLDNLPQWLKDRTINKGQMLRR